MYAVIIGLIGILILAGIAASAVQQNRERKDTAQRDEVSRQRAIIDETEGAITAAGQMPVSPQLISILHRRILNALKQTYECNKSSEVKLRIADTSTMLKGIDVSEPPPDQNSFHLPENDKVIIKYIQAIKKLRVMLRSEHSKGNITPQVFSYEDKQLERLQLRVNIETLAKRARDALRSNMAGSSREYLEKAIGVLKKQKHQDEYCVQRCAEFEQMLDGIESSMKKSNQAQIQADKDAENKELDELFAPKKKW